MLSYSKLILSLSAVTLAVHILFDLKKYMPDTTANFIIAISTFSFLITLYRVRFPEEIKGKES